jgi:hypothetical protein
MGDPQSLVRTPELNDVIDLAVGAALRDLHVAKIGVVQSYDPTTQTASIAPAIQVPVTAADGSTSFVAGSVINGVPVLFPSGGGFRLVCPVQRGDFVTLLFTDNSLDVWKSLGGDSVAPIMLGFHGFNDCVAIPGAHPNPLPWSVQRTDSAYFGKDGGPEVEVTPSNINLGAGASAPVGRVGDQVKCFIPIGAVVISVVGGTGITNPAPIECDGTITQGSPLVNSR